MSQVVIGTAGHIDHGKTALVKALTGTNTDRLAEEQARGMTIDLGFAFLTENITIIDVPGHEKFIRNMVSGVSTIQIGLFVIAADDGVMPQTIEHLQILSLLQIPQGVIALTKTDLADEEWTDLVEEDIHQLCKGTFLENAPIVRTSTANGRGIEELRKILLEQAEKVHEKNDRGFFRLQIDRSFIKTGFGTVVTGTVISGELKKGDEIQILPAEKIGRVRGLQSHEKLVDSVKLGDRAAVNIAGLDKKDLWRGAELISNGWLKPTLQIIAHISMIPKTKWIIKSKQRVRIYIGTQELLGRVFLIKKSLKEGESGNALIQFELPAVVAMDDRFVIRSYSPLNTIGGGIVLDTDLKGTVKSQKLWTKDLAIEPEKRYLQFINREINNPNTLDEWCKIFHTSNQTLKSIIIKNKLLTTKGKPLIYSSENLEESKVIIIKILEEFYKNNPYQKSMKGEELKEKSNFNSNWFEFVLSDLISKEEVKQIQAGYALANYGIELYGKDQQKAEIIEKLIGSFDYEPITINLLAEESELPTKKVLELLHVLKGQEKVIDIAEGMWAGRLQIEEMKKKLKQYFAKSDKLSVVQFKDITGLTRKSVIPLLEYFDRKKITMRDGNERLKGEAL
ncbi:selenocysteine-specific translation elongation factor [bacterium]|nr:selenocysteine-specific translation elongation factor [bacterium]